MNHGTHIVQIKDNIHTKYHTMMKIYPLVGMFLLLCTATFAQLTIHIDEIPLNTPRGDAIYIGGSFNNWMAGDWKYQFKKNRDKTYTLELDLTEPTILKYKVSRGNWEKSEGNNRGGYREERVFKYDGTPTEIHLKVESWEDLYMSGKSTAAENVFVLNEHFPMPQLDRKRKIWVYLPPGYDTSSLYYPVLYIQDGQNLFDKYASFSLNEWGVDEFLNRYKTDSTKQVIIVGIESEKEHRLNEYSPWKNKYYGGGEGEAYVQFIANTLKPHIDKNFRTLGDSRHTGIMGSTLGGVLALYATLEYPEVFGKAGVFSPSFWFSIEAYHYAKAIGKRDDVKIFMLAGEDEGPSIVNGMTQMYNILYNAGFNHQAVTRLILEKGQHEELWGKAFGQAIDWLFENETPQNTPILADSFVKKSVPTSKPINQQLYFKLLPRPIEQIILMETNANLQDIYLEFLDKNDKKIAYVPNLQNNRIDISQIPLNEIFINIYHKKDFITKQRIVLR